ncbi:adrenodoxin-like protein 2, mitochondrial [Impatiens glandulifera]|uniref:adrenodoxin-like protein 2, mitochondrial n=1 Tax=Impatiens glandulifera TaxID=253017 RepID=UPI001FB06C98|nr:adrenodoxin-like protein 2, mitochondrial [Impatiens glandulifera]
MAFRIRAFANRAVYLLRRSISTPSTQRRTIFNLYPSSHYLQSFTGRSILLPQFNSRLFSSTKPQEGGNEEKISVSFLDKDGEVKHVNVPIGMSMLEAAVENDVEIEGACDGCLACSTCHCIVMDIEYYNKLEDPTDEENDMLDLAFGLTKTSRLGCQVIAKPELNGMRLAVPTATRNISTDQLKQNSL